MIVEDEVVVAMNLREVLIETGFQVLDLTIRQAEALEVARAGKPDLALVNIQLADGDDGIELAVQLEALSIPVVFISGQISRARSANTVAIASMPKPYEPNEMAVAVAYLLARLRGSTALARPDRLEVFDESLGLEPAL
ncbi:response regulator [Brevundimonas sp. SL161]|uniref:response regulator n=1 Tax=Brevundimonas sp. SL161 TaxID=2804613 RepID=UPI003CFB0A81